MKKKQVAYILMALGAVAAVIYYFSTKNTENDDSATSEDKTMTISDDNGTYNQLMGLVPVANRQAVATLAGQRYVSGNVAPWTLANGSITQTGAFMSAYLHYYGVSGTETQNRIKAFQIWDAFKARN